MVHALIAFVKDQFQRCLHSLLGNFLGHATYDVVDTFIRFTE